MLIAGGAAVITLLVVVAVLVAIYLGRNKKPAAKPFEHVKVSRLTQDGRAGGEVAISPDGRYVAYLVGDDKGRRGALGPAGRHLERRPGRAPDR